MNHLNVDPVLPGLDFCLIYIYIYKGRYGAMHQTKILFVALDPVRDTIMIGIFI